jgi:O-antigen/teichoic acid export membrane protein
VTSRLVGVLRRPAAGAVAGQVTQAGAALVLQVAAARFLGAAGLATFSLVYGAIVLVTAVSSGLVGDSLTVLDRADPATRAALHVWAVAVSGIAGVLGVALTLVTGLLPVWAAVVLGLAVTAFVLEDVLRRLLMATGRFWSLPAVDATSLVLALLTLVGCASAGRLTLASFMVALLVGQAGAGVVAWLLAPRGERPTGPWRSPAVRHVFDFGVWRAAGQTVRPALLTALRLLVVATAGAAAYGPIEAARVYTAPTLIVVTGLGSYLLPHFVSIAGRPAPVLLRNADRAAGGLAVGVAVIGAVLLALLSVLAPLLTGGDFPVPVSAVAGWGVYAVASAVLLPYSGLATVYRRQRRVLALRTLEFVSLAAVVVLLVLPGRAELWTPLALAIGPLLTALAVRALVLRPLLRNPAETAAAPVEVPISL